MWEGETQMSELADLKFDGQDQYAADLHVQVETKDGTARAAVILAGAGDILSIDLSAEQATELRDWLNQFLQATRNQG
jgi:hypothetical protein